MELPKYKSYLIDTNILIYSINKDSSYHSSCRELLTNLNSNNYSVFVSTQNLREAYRVLSHPKFPNPMPATTIAKAINIWTASFKIVFETEEVWKEFKNLSNSVEPQGNRVFDVWLAATGIANNIDTILTVNTKDFTDIKKINTVNPLT